MAKYELLKGQLDWEGIISDSDWIEPIPMEDEDIRRSHDPSYWNRLKSGNLDPADERRSGFRWSPELVLRERIIMQGTLECAKLAAQGQVALNIAGGTHHAFFDRPEGFCLLNDFVISADWLHDRGLAHRILIVDLDVHQGNGTAAMAAQRPHIFCLSLHCGNNYPFHKEQSSLDVSLPQGTDDEHYLDVLSRALQQSFDQCTPDVVLYQCGVDVLASDKLGKLNLSLDGCRKRDDLVFATCRDRGLGVACAMGGGYSPDIQTIVEAHMQTFRSARDHWT